MWIWLNFLTLQWDVFITLAWGYTVIFGDHPSNWAAKSLQMVIAAMKLKDAYSLEETLWPT